MLMERVVCSSGAGLQRLTRDQVWQPYEPVSGEDEELGDGWSTSQPVLGSPGGLFQPANGLLNQPSLAQRDSVAGMPRRPRIDVGTADVFMLLTGRHDAHVRAVMTKS